MITPGRIVGITTRTMVPMIPRPSSRAASSTSFGNCLKKGRNMMIAKGRVPVTSAKMIDGRVLTIPAWRKSTNIGIEIAMAGRS